MSLEIKTIPNQEYDMLFKVLLVGNSGVLKGWLKYPLSAIIKQEITSIKIAFLKTFWTLNLDGFCKLDKTENIPEWHSNAYMIVVIDWNNSIFFPKPNLISEKFIFCFLWWILW